MASINSLDNLPKIDLLEDEGLTYDSIVNDMIADYESKWKDLTGEDLTLYPADSRRILLNVTAGKLFQLASIINERHKLNFLQYMHGDFLKNWASCFGFKEDGTESAKVTLRFHLQDEQLTDVTIPAGTRVTSGDKVFFQTDEETSIVAGELYVDTSATCMSVGTQGNGYLPGQLNLIVDPINLVDSVENTTTSAGGHDEYTNEELRELIYNFPDVYSVAGPENAYIELVKMYSSNIVDVKVTTTKEALVKIYVLLQNGSIPPEDYCNKIYEFIKSLKQTPDTDKVEVIPPTVKKYSIKATYYIPIDKKEIADGIKEAIEDAGKEFAEYTKSKIGRAINPGILTAYVNAAGGSRIEIEEPVYQTIAENEVAICENLEITFGDFDRE